MRLALFFLVLLPLGVGAQQTQKDSLRHLLGEPLADTMRVDVLNKLGNISLAYSTDTLVKYSLEALELATELGYKKGRAEAFKNLGVGYYLKGSYELGLNQFIEALKISEQIGNKELMSRIRHNIGAVYFTQENFKLAVVNITEAYKIAEEIGDSTSMATEQLTLCSCFERLEEPNRAIHYCEQTLKYFKRHHLEERTAHAYHYLGQSYILLKSFDEALSYFWMSKDLVENGQYNSVGCDLYRDMGDLYVKLDNYDSSMYYYKKTMHVFEHYDNAQSKKMLYYSLSKHYERENQIDSAFYYNKEYANLLQNDFKARVRDQLSSVQAYYELELNRNELMLSHEEIKSRNTIIIAISMGVIILIALLLIIWRFYVLKQTANQALKNLNRKITIQSLKLTQANDEIKRINENLETIVEERTKEIQHKNEILIEYAHSNAHKVRGPLARILGVLSIINLTIHDTEFRELTDRIQENANELDGVVREINQRLEE